MKIDQPGIYTMSAADYHAIETPTPVLSASIARRLLGASPLHAWYDHHALNPAGVREQKEEFDLGTAAHAWLLEGSRVFEVIDALDWRTKDARERRDAIRAEGKVPLLASQWSRVQAMTESLGESLSGIVPAPFAYGKPEQTLVWREGETWCKARLDWWRSDFSLVDDFKSTENASPEAWSRHLFALGFDLQAQWYLRGVKALADVEADFRFVVAETRPPYAVSVISLTPEAADFATRKIGRALEMWRECLRTQTWPGYPAFVVHATLPPWAEAAWTEREYRDQDIARRGVVDDGRPIEELLLGDQR